MIDLSMLIGYVVILVLVLVMCKSVMGNAKEEIFFKETVNKIEGFILDLIFDAEKIYKSGTGQFKKAYVINLLLNGEFYKGLPLFIQKMITAELLGGLVDNIVSSVFNKAKESNQAVQERLEG